MAGPAGAVECTGSTTPGAGGRCVPIMQLTDPALSIAPPGSQQNTFVGRPAGHPIVAGPTPILQPNCLVGIPYIETGNHGDYETGCLVDGKKHPLMAVGDPPFTSGKSNILCPPPRPECKP